MKEAMWYKKLSDERVRCDLCNHRCVINNGKRGICGVRENKEGTLFSLVYGKVIASHVDPIEKKPLFHFYPGSYSFSIATAGCNFKCTHCQNSDISQMPIDNNRIMGQDILPEKIVELALRGDCQSISYTYTEPTIFMEYALDVAKIAKDKGLKNVYVTNGYMTEEVLNEVYPYMDAANVDLKGFTEEHYQNVCGARLKPVMDTIRLMKQLGVWVELTTLIIPTINDSEDDLRRLAEFIFSIGREIPWHVSRFHPTYKMNNLPPTPVRSVIKARKIGLEVGLRYVYTGNIQGDDGENTYCYNCGKSLIERHGYNIGQVHVKDSKCSFCGADVDIELED
ncbi:MAG: pyruvate formate lyase activating enzyme [Candidatus Poribacteria bacterium]|nr:pyruvate formate lyase activating enzyme [Candidatus Poribacteria bacterium]